MCQVDEYQLRLNFISTEQYYSKSKKQAKNYQKDGLEAKYEKDNEEIFIFAITFIVVPPIIVNYVLALKFSRIRIFSAVFNFISTYFSSFVLEILVFYHI